MATFNNNQEKFNQEFGNEFAGSGHVRLFDNSVIETLRKNKKKEQ